jgi:ubiquitin-protein ligase
VRNEEVGCTSHIPVQSFVNSAKKTLTIVRLPFNLFHPGIYHGRIMLPTDYPFKPPAIMLLTVI